MVTLPMVGFCVFAVKLLGPPHAYVAFGINVAVRSNCSPTQSEASIAPAVGAGVSFTTTVVVPARLTHPSAEAAVTE